MRFFVPAVIFISALCAQDAARLAEDPAIKSAFAAIEKNEPHFIEEQIRICEIPAPPFHEDVRGKGTGAALSEPPACKMFGSIKPAT